MLFQNSPTLFNGDYTYYGKGDSKPDGHPGPFYLRIRSTEFCDCCYADRYQGWSPIFIMAPPW